MVERDTQHLGQALVLGDVSEDQMHWHVQSVAYISQNSVPANINSVLTGALCGAHRSNRLELVS